MTRPASPLEAAVRWFLDRDPDDNVAAVRAKLAGDPDWQTIRAQALAGDEEALDAIITAAAMHAHGAIAEGFGDVTRLERATIGPPARRGRRRK